MNKKTTFFIGGVVFLIALLLQAPATLLAVLTSRFTHQQVLLTATKGSLWTGSANVAISTQQLQEQIGFVQWKLLPSDLLMGKIAVEFSWDRSTPALFVWSVNQVAISHLDIILPAKVVNGFVSSFKAAELGGQLRIHTDSLMLSGTTVNGMLSVYWNQVSSPLTSTNPLGEYQVILTGSAGGADVELKTLTGALKLDGHGDWSMAGGLKFAGVAKADLAQQVELSPLLHMIGNEEVVGSGQYQFNLL